MNITLRQMQMFVALADTGSVSLAARACHVSQPTASMQLREMTQAVGLPLHEVIGRRIRLTDAGRQLADTARGMLDQWAGFGQAVDQMKGLTRGRLRLSVVSTAKYFVPRLLGGFCHHYPDIDIALEVLNRDAIVERLRAGLDDLVIMSIPPADLDLDQQAFLANPLVVIAPLAHPLAARRRIRLAQLGEQPMILREPGSGTRMSCDAAFARQGFDPRVRLTLGSNEAIKQVVAAGMGIGIVSRHALVPRPADEGLAVLPVGGFPIHANWFIVRRRQRRLSPIAQAFEQHLLLQARAIDPGGSAGNATAASAPGSATG
ncbi:MAG: LysR family transcriptional regulator [Burkholderiaceae bacterium]